MKGPRSVQTPFQQASTSSYGWETPTDTPDVKSLRDLNLTEVDPGIGYTYGSAKRRIGETFDNPYGSYTTPAIREATERNAYGDLAQQEGAATQEASFQNRSLDFGRKQALAEMTQPRLVQTGGNQSGFNTQLYQPQNVWGQVAQGAGAAGAAAL